MTTTHEPVVFMIPGDLHLTEDGLDNHRTAQWVVEQANGLIRPDFVQFIGDNVQDATAEQFRLFRDLVGRLHCPWYALVGDHDAQGDPAAAAHRQFVGEPTGATSLRGFRFVRLNTQEAKPVGLSPEQVNWFRGEVDAARSAGERVVVFQHNYPFQIWETFDGPGIGGWREVVQTRPVTAIFCGHTHYLQTANDGRNVVTAVRSIGDPEGGLAGYLLGYLSGHDLAFAYRTPEDVGPVVLITHPRDALVATGPAHVVAGSGEARVRVWADVAVTGVEGRLDDRPWAPMAPASAQDWTASLPAGLAKGEHRFEARATDAAGRVGRHTVMFVADPTGRYTAVPATRPAVSQTSFC